MLPINFKEQNQVKRKKLLSTLKTYTITYDYELNSYYGEYIKDSYKRWGNVVDIIGTMKLNGYEKEDIEFNFHQLMKLKYIDTNKLISYTITDITH
tara:strand:- start:112 stop:399 length:288 start_codon:yes stop_codon:yes gene_type:complete